MTSRGVLIHAHNNEQIDYALISLCNALSIKAHMNVPVCLVTDEGSINWLRSKHGALAERAFERVIAQEHPMSSHWRVFKDTASSFTLPWHNSGRADSYGLSPYDETLLIDADHLVMDATLNVAWGSMHDVMINRRAAPLDHGPLAEGERWISHTGIEMCWATCVYFRKSPLAENLFTLVRHVKENYSHYSMVYDFPDNLFRNDYAFSIAVHMMSGFTKCGDIPTLPSPCLLTSFDRDELIDVPKRGSLVFLMNDRKESWRFRAVRTDGISVHVMNKFSIVRQAHKFIELYS